MLPKETVRHVHHRCRRWFFILESTKTTKGRILENQNLPVCGNIFCRLYSSNNSSNKNRINWSTTLPVWRRLSFFYIFQRGFPSSRNISTQCRSARLFPTVAHYTGHRPWRLNMSRYVVLIPDIPWDCLEIDVSISIVYLHMYIHINSSPQDPGLTFSH